MKLKYILAALLIGFLMISCGDDDEPETETCDTTAVTYNNGAAAIINTTCATSPACHNNAASAPSFPMSNYTQSFAAAGFNKIVGAINHTAGFSMMPPSGTKIDQCDIDILTAWIAAGAPE